jgi:Ran GTPase-activating protein (RanGAP) involved in mRNA processing and transport
MDEGTSSTDYDMSSCASDISLPDTATMSDDDCGYDSSREEDEDDDNMSTTSSSGDEEEATQRADSMTLTLISTAHGTVKVVVEGTTPLHSVANLTIESSLVKAIPAQYVSFVLETSNQRRIKTLRLSQVALMGTDYDFQKLTATIRSLTNLESLHLVDCYLLDNDSTSRPLEQLLYGISEPGALPLLRHLELYAVDIEIEQAGSFLSVGALAHLVQHKPSLTRLSLEDLTLENEHVMHLARALAFNKNLTHLKLWGCAVEDVGVTALAAMLVTNTALQQMDLSYNEVTDVGYTALARSLQVNKTLQVLKLVRCGDITPEGYKAILELFQWNHNIKELLLHPAPQHDSNLGFYLFVNQHRYLVENENMTKSQLVDLLFAHRNDPTFLFLFLKAKPSLCGDV